MTDEQFKEVMKLLQEIRDLVAMGTTQPIPFTPWIPTLPTFPAAPQPTCRVCGAFENSPFCNRSDCPTSGRTMC